MNIIISGLDQTLSRLKKSQEAVKDLRPAFYDIQDVLVQEYKANFDEKGATLEQSWPKRKFSYPWPILQKTGKLKNTWQTKPEKSQLSIKNPVDYATYHHFGTPRLPIRKLIGITGKMMKNIIDRIKKHIFSNF